MNCHDNRISPALPKPALFAWRHGALCLLAAALLLLPGPARAAEFYRQLESARGLGLGGAYTASAQSIDAMLYNPAGLMMHNYWKVEARSFTEESDGDGGYFGDLEQQRGNTVSQAQNFLDREGDQPVHAREFNLLGFHNTTGWGVALYESIQRQSDPVSDTDLQLSYDRIYGGIWTQAYTSENRLALWGFNLRYMGREVVSRLVSADEIVESGFAIDDQTSTGNDWDADLGLILRLPSKFLRPQIGLAVLNVNSPDFGFNQYDPIDTETNVAIAFYPAFFDTMQVMVSAEARDVSKTTNSYDTRDITRNHVGLELSMFKISDGLWGLQLRAGSTQGLNSMGATVNLGHFVSAELAVYEERLIYENEDVRQTRTLAQISFGF